MVAVASDVASSGMRLNDFALARVIGKGGYGKVMLVRPRADDSQVYAMKVLRKEDVVKRNQVEHTKTERNVLEAASHPFIVTLVYAFQTPKKLYFVLEYCPGGELFYHLSRAMRFSDTRCRFYTSELVLAIEYLHSLDIIYRDLKPENVLLDAEGHVKLTDFGMSKEGIRDNVSAQSMCGTPEYLAPEILEGKGHGRAVDWYSLGALMFEMLTGMPPFYTRNRERLFEDIRSGELVYPKYVAQAAKEVLQALMLRDPSRRLGAGQEDGKEVRAHAFFAGVDWQATLARDVKPPFRPKVAARDDVQNVAREFLRLQAADSEVQQGPQPDLCHFDGFSFHRPRPAPGADAGKLAAAEKIPAAPDAPPPARRSMGEPEPEPEQSNQPTALKKPRRRLSSADFVSWMPCLPMPLGWA